MSTEPTEVVPVGDAPTEQSAEPELKQEVAQPEGEQKTDESSELDPAKKLELAERTIKRLERRAEKLSWQKGEAARERDALREQFQKPAAGEDQEDSAKPDIERLATQRAQEIVEYQTLEKQAAAMLKAGGKFEGFEKAIATLREEVPFVDSKGRLTPFLSAVLESDGTPAEKAALVNYLGNNPEEAAEFDGLSPVQIGRRLARLEDKLEQAGKLKTSKAPAPINPIGNGRGIGQADLENADFETYKAMRRKQGARW